jgi:uncharacterized protein
MANPNPYPYFRPRAVDGATASAGLRRYLAQVYNYMAGGLVVTGVTAYVGASSGFYASLVGTPWYWAVLFAPLVLVLVFGYRMERMSVAAAQLTYWAFALLFGLSLSGIFYIYTQQSIGSVFFVTAAMFAATSVYAYTTRTDLTRFGSFLFMGLIGVVIAAVVNIFLHSTALQMTISVMGVIVFTGLAAWHTQRIRANYVYGEDGTITTKKAIYGALALYLDFVNLFISLLQLTGDRRR